jgi:hypothetical protein
VADINDRLEKLTRRDELTRRVLQQHRVVPPEVSGVGADFMDVVDAVANVVRRHPGMSIMIAPGDGRRGSAVIRVTELHGDAEVAVVATAPGGKDASAPDGQDGSVPPPAEPVDKPAATARPESRPVWQPPRRWRPEPGEPQHRETQYGETQYGETQYGEANGVHGEAQYGETRYGEANGVHGEAQYGEPQNREPQNREAQNREDRYGGAQYGGGQQDEWRWSG